MWDGVELEMAASTKAGQVQPDPSLSAWRTVHALQRERGVSCVIMASNGVLYKDLLSSARQESDEAVQASESEDFKHLLDAERTGFDDALQVASATPSLSGERFYTLYVAFSNLVHRAVGTATSGVIHHTEGVELFARLKEELAKERGFVAGALALPEDGVSSLPRRAFADFVLCRHSQRAHVARLREVISDQEQLELVNSGMTPTVVLDEVRKRLLRTFDVTGVRATTSLGEWWQMMDEHIEQMLAVQKRLHALTMHGRSSSARSGSIDSKEASSHESSVVGDELASRAIVSKVADAIASTTPLKRRHGLDGDGASGAPDASGAPGASVAADGCSMQEKQKQQQQPSVEDIEVLSSSLVALPAETIKRSLLSLLQRRSCRISSEAKNVEIKALEVAKMMDNPRVADNAPDMQLSQTLRSVQPVRPAAGQGKATAGSVAPVAKSGPDRAMPMGLPYSGVNLAPLVPPDLVISLSELAFIRQIGHGASARCYEAQWASSGSSTVAVKVSSVGADNVWLSEASLLQRLRHPNVITLLGLVIAPPTFCLVLEYCAGGDVFEACQRPTPPGFTMRVARGVAAGMAYLHRKGVIHRDLKSANILLDAVGQPKLTDFGTATVGLTNQPQRRGALTAETGTYRWMAPEVILHETYSRPADVFSFGMVLFELLTRESPFADRPAVGAAMAVAMEQKRPTLPEGTPLTIAALTQHCWAHQPANRPTFIDLDILLAHVQNSLSNEERLWLDAPRGHPVYQAVSSAGAVPSAAVGPAVANELPAAMPPATSPSFVAVPSSSSSTRKDAAIGADGPMAKRRRD